MPADKNHKPLRQVASEKLHGKDANPSLLGDPVSLAAEQKSTDGTQLAPTPTEGDQTKKDPADHDNGPSGSQGSAPEGGRSKL
jgi:hypothetical protein